MSRRAAATAEVEPVDSSPAQAARKSRKGSKNRTQKRERAPSQARAPRSRALQEVLAVMLCCSGLLTVLALVSYDARDASLNAAGGGSIANWIGPAGAYWADLLLQSLGIGAFALSLGALLAGWRSVSGRRVLPGIREAGGTVLLTVCSGALAQLMMAEKTSYPAGGIGGAILATLLVENFATVGAFIIATALVLLALALTADGILTGLGWRGFSALAELLSRFRAAVVVVIERHRQLRRLRAQRRAESAPEKVAAEVGAPAWGFDAEAFGERREKAKERIEKAKERGAKLAQKRAEREAARQLEVVPKARNDRSEPEFVLDRTLDLAAEEAFSIGNIGIVEREPVDLHPAAVGEDSSNEIDVPIRAANADPENDTEYQSSGDSGKAKGHERKAPTPVRAKAGSAAAPSPAARATGATAPEAADLAEPEIVDVRPEVDAAEIANSNESLADESDVKPAKEFELPSTALLDFAASTREEIDPQKLRDNAQKLVRTLREYKIEGTIREIRPGPVVTMYEFVPAPGIKISRIAGLSDDLAMSMAAMRVRIVAPIPGKGAVGIEIPNDSTETVFFKEIITNDAFKQQKSKLTIALGKDIEGKPVCANLAKMPHLLVAGATGAGKSVSVNSMIMSILFKATPEQVRFIMVDPKMLELSIYNGIPHLLLPVVTDPKKAALALRWAVEEMERRYRLLSDAGVKNIDGFNTKIEAAEASGERFVLPPEKEGEKERVCERMPYIVVIVDELADLMMVASRDVESSIMRMAQMARAAGIHLILATQRPSVDVITGSIKANLPTRIAFKVAQKNDSRTILDQNGAQNLLGKGDMLFMSNGASGVQRVHGAFLSEEDVERTVDFIRAQGQPDYDESIVKPRGDDGSGSGGVSGDDDKDEMYDQAIAIVTESQQASISMIQRKLKIGYNRAARMVEQMEEDGVVGAPDGSKPRQVLAPPPPEL